MAAPILKESPDGWVLVGDRPGLAEFVVSGLPDGDAQALLESVITGPLDEQVRDRVVAETRGNPLALLELARGLTPGELAGGIGLPCVTAMPGRIEEGFQRQLMPLPPATRRLLLVAAAEPTGDPLLVWRAADRLGVSATAAAPAAAAGLIEFGGHVRFCRAAPRAPQPPGGNDLLLDGLAVLLTEGNAAGTPMLRRALKAFRDGALTDEGFQWLPLACSMARDIWDDESWYALSTRLIEHARHAGALTVLPPALLMGVPIRLLAGELAVAVSLAQEAEAVGRATAKPVGPYGRMVLTAWTGREAEACQVTATATREMAARGEGQWLTAAHWVTAVLNNGFGRYDEALVAAEQGRSQYPDELGLAVSSMAELIEAAARSGQPERAAGAMRHLSEATATAGSDWALGIQARSRALLSDGESAECLYREAIDRLGRTRVRVELARAHLVYGEWLRRQNRRVDARDQLRTAYEMLTAMGIDGFAERARRGLLATGETVRKRTVETAGQLTGQEAQIARLASEGNTNPEIGAQLFLSPRTVEYHLHKAFRKLGISSRRELRRALPNLRQAAFAA